MSKKLRFGVLIASFLFVSLLFINRETTNTSQPRNSDRIANTILTNIKRNYILKNGVVMSEPGKTTSESQSYVMLIAVLSGDRKMFDKTWRWTKENLQIREDNLFSWLWENKKVRDKNSAADADQDIALSLFLAYKKWGNEIYLSESKKILNDIWGADTKVINGKRYISGGNWALEDNDGLTINPSYLAPYVYRIFASIDKNHDWMSLVDNSYEILNKCSSISGLLRDWCRIDNRGNIVDIFTFDNKDASLYSYDALRVPFRLALDYLFYNEQRAMNHLKTNNVILNDWVSEGKIYAVYDSKGKNVGDGESLASYGVQLANFGIINKNVADEIFREKMQTIDFSKKISFYDLSWLWFGLNFYSGGFEDIKATLIN